MIFIIGDQLNFLLMHGKNLLEDIEFLLNQHKNKLDLIKDKIVYIWILIGVLYSRNLSCH
jgi:hypothetical protein